MAGGGRENGLELYLKRRRISLAHVARESGLEQSHVWRIVKGQREPGIRSFKALAVSLRLPMEQLYTFLYPH